LKILIGKNTFAANTLFFPNATAASTTKFDTSVEFFFKKKN